MRPASCNPSPTSTASRIGVTGSCMSATTRAMSSSLFPSSSSLASRIEVSMRDNTTADSTTSPKGERSRQRNEKAHRDGF